jgi:hypothetical protein
LIWANARNNYENLEKGFQLWRYNAEMIEYDTLEADQILRLAIEWELISEEDEGKQGADALKDKRIYKLYVDDFDAFILQTVGERDHSVRNTRLEAFKKALEAGLPDVVFWVTLFSTTTNPWSLAKSELEWITYLFNGKYTMKQVEEMPMTELTFNYRKIRDDFAARAMLRKDVENSAGSTVPLNCIDVGYRSLNRLQSLRDELLVLYPAMVDKQASTAEFPIRREPWGKSRSHIISVAELEGGDCAQGCGHTHDCADCS